LTDFDAELPLLRSPSPFLSRSAGEEGGWGEGEGRRACSAAQAPKPDIAHHYQILSKAQVFDHAHKSAIIVRV